MTYKYLNNIIQYINFIYKTNINPDELIDSYNNFILSEYNYSNKNYHLIHYLHYTGINLFCNDIIEIEFIIQYNTIFAQINKNYAKLNIDITIDFEKDIIIYYYINKQYEIIKNKSNNNICNIYYYANNTIKKSFYLYKIIKIHYYYASFNYKYYNYYIIYIMNYY